MCYSYNSIFSHGVTNAFSAILHPSYLCMKLPASRGITAVYGDQNTTRIAVDVVAPSRKNVHYLKEKDKEIEKEESPNEPVNPHKHNPQSKFSYFQRTPVRWSQSQDSSTTRSRTN